MKLLVWVAVIFTLIIGEAGGGWIHSPYFPSRASIIHHPIWIDDPGLEYLASLLVQIASPFVA